MNPVQRAFAFVGTVLRRALQLARLARVRLACPGVVVGPGARLSAGVVLQATDGGRVRIGRNCHVGRGTIIRAQGGEIAIGDDAFIGPWCVLTSKESVSIGDDALIAERVSIRDQNHRIHGAASTPIRAAGFDTAPVAIADDVWIGAGVVVLQGVTVGAGAVVAANSVVTRAVPARTIVGGAPAVRLSERRDDGG